MLTYKDTASYHRDGFVVVRDVFTPQEVAKLIDAVEHGDRVARTTRSGKDAEGKPSNLAIWHDLGDDIWSAASTCPRLVNNVRILLGEDAAFFHGKVILKEARTGGAWEWHQDYGYWYNQGFVYPNMISAFVALDPATIKNGCLQVLKGSHLLGRLDHGKVGTQTGVEALRLKQIESLFERVHCELSAGSVLFFHSNLLHASAPNESDHHRRAFIVCYNAVSNPQVNKEGKAIVRQSCPVGADDAILR
ncbi:MAG: phytanoyl-CoA dioxygenase family protein [Paenibacillaceae bacterium]|jgi:ectoine hydroxylase-related dioxygenase (phytanoyl-CoA dioxygenase family)|nr:phytanoyl-CoA dioxygenase family protein [Paenibacillaceae bacterium]